MNGNLFARLADGFPADRRATLLETVEGGRWSLAETLELTGRLATLMRAAGVAPGDRVAAQVGASPQAVCLYLACLQAGAVFVPLDPAAAPAALAGIVADAEPRLLVCEPAAEAELAPVAAAAGAAVYTLAADGTGRLTAEAVGLPSERSVALRAGADVAAIVYGEAAGARPRGAMLSHDNLWSNAAALHWLWGFRSGDVLIHALPLHQADGLFVALNPILMNGGRAILLPRHDAEAVIGLLPRASVLMGGPALYAGLLGSRRLTRAAAAGMRLFVAGAGPMPPLVLAAFEARVGARVLERYGTVETGVVAADGLDGARCPGSVGRALPGVGLRVVDAEGRALGPDAAGALEAQGPGVFRGYWRDPEGTAGPGADGWFATGDRAAIDAEGYVTLLGRDGGAAGLAFDAMAGVSRAAS
ncbi:AMP-binding protein [Amaricoccus sp.]|uniref:AMP-binding protein n=1 Tax=Amaricoccus sp. TaxID=1872485 RepID=UPI001B430AFE|nr:AMP-binding protein [Amaricoccus sp.]MBP7002971.1 AMP-binding protein [Amaricoccus sp.]